MKQIVIKNNEFLDGSLEKLQIIMKRPFPKQLEELRLISLKTGPIVMTKLCKFVSLQCNLRKLALVQVQLSDTNAVHLCKIIDEARFLEELDISWNHLTPSYMKVITGHLAENRTLRTVNLSWNFLTTQRNKDYIAMIDDDELITEEAAYADELRRQGARALASLAGSGSGT